MERIIRLDYFRLILSLLVITIHMQPLFGEDSLAGWLISNGIARIAVPFFFILSGYFISTKLDDRKYTKNYLLHLLIMYIVWSLLYLPTYYQEIEPRSFITSALLGYYHLWFLPALIIAVILLLIVKRFINNDRIILYTGFPLFIIGYYLEYKGLYYRTYCNGLFFGYPFLVLGYCINKRIWIERFKGFRLYLFLIIGLVFLFLDSYLGYVLNTHKNMIIALYIFCPMLFVLLLKGAKKKIVSGKINPGQLATGIYYIHILVIALAVPLSETYNIVTYPIVATLSILLSIFVIFVNKRIKIFL
ncbi:surface polysaccharide O-acyltransferase-like enzyme [Dysgonomonas hofstadii]|uniref:Surface polysaccharide O-acyltransferase-like enzyme n=1 Tax=Dysgonomonas hofstadii TaxID=637886 RepID=A0A840CV46_9BACT|nr:acyltransferase family protein [Dysgonomonas hofstadii]MBB4035663.1 surface polysaccharide O-acyltransferase-like enzyme [Dysgonomonas hofstadii]